MFWRGIHSFPVFIKFVHKIASVAGYRDHPLAISQSDGKPSVVAVGHFETIRFAIPSCGMDIWRVTVKKGSLVVVQLNDLDCGSALNLNSQQTHYDLRKALDTSKPTRHDPRHPSPACILAICPTPKGSRLSQACSCLPRSHKKPSCTFQVGGFGGLAVKGTVKLHTGKWGEANCLNELFLLIPENLEKVHHITIYVVVRLHRRRVAVKEDGGRTAERFAIVVTLWEQWQEPIQVAEFASIPAKGNQPCRSWSLDPCERILHENR